MSSHREQHSTNFSIEKLLCNDNGNNTSKVNLKQKQRRRSSFTAIQVHWLEAEFRCHRYVSPERRAGLAAFLGLTQQQVNFVISRVAKWEISHLLEILAFFYNHLWKKKFRCSYALSFLFM